MGALSKGCGFGLAALALALTAAAPDDPPSTLFDARLAEVRFASVSWATRSKRTRVVGDVVCLVSDLPGFLAALSAWDREFAFPILFDDAEYSLKFLRAFRPKRVVRIPTNPRPIAQSSLWQAMESAVGASWRAPGARASETGDQAPIAIAPNVPGIVFSSPTSPSLAGAAALAAGRFQPILPWEPAKTYGDRITEKEADVLARDLENRVAIRFPKHEALGDDCDFVTLAGDYPFAYEVSGGQAPGRSAFDDRVGFFPETGRRWAYTGRLLGNPAASLYRAMCSLFLDTDSAAMIDGYDSTAAVWSTYALPAAQDRLAALFPVERRSGPEQAGINGWRKLFANGNPFGLLLINSRGTPTRFFLQTGEGGLEDVPESVPCVVHKIHSFSASDPRNPETLAGRWLDSGAYVYFGALNEPFLLAFRTPTLVADLIAEGLPLSAAFRQNRGEALSEPWRMVYLGDPLCTIRPTSERRPRDGGGATLNWPSITLPTDKDGDDEARLAWARADASLRAAQGEPVGQSQVFVTTLLSIRRDRLSSGSRERFDALLAAAASKPSAVPEVRSRLEAIPKESRSRAVVRALDHLRDQGRDERSR